MPDARRERVVDGGVTKGARDADVGERVVRVDLSEDAEYRTQFEQRDGRRGIVEVDRAVL